MNTINNEILSAIDNIETVTLESEMNVITAMCDAYIKSSVIMENYTGDDYSCFDIFQEGISDQLNKPVLGEKGENIIKRILLFIPRLLHAIGRRIKKLWDNRKSKQLQNKIDELERKISELSEAEKNDIVNSTSQILREGRSRAFADEKYSEHINDRINELERIHNIRLDALEKSHEVLKTALSGDIHSRINFEKVCEYLEDIHDTIEQIKSWDIYRPSTFPKSVDKFENVSTDTHNNTVVFFGESRKFRLCRLSNVKKYMDKMDGLVKSICKNCSELENKISALGYEYSDNVSKKKDGKLNTRQQEVLDQIQKVAKYLSAVHDRTASDAFLIREEYERMEAIIETYLYGLSGVVRKDD